MGECRKQKIRVALAGNPNVGKSTLFNTLTGMHQHTGNWPGKTVAVAQGNMETAKASYHFVDLPGTYSLEGKSQDEQIAAQYILEMDPDCTVIVCDGTCLSRSLILALEIIPDAKNPIVCVNLMDEAKRHGIRIDRKALSDALGVPVVFTSAGKGEGLTALTDVIYKTVTESEKKKIEKLADPIEGADRIASQCVKLTYKKSYRFQIDRLFAGRKLGFPLMILLLLGIIWITVWGANYPSMMLEQAFSSGYTVLSGWLSFLPLWLKGLLLDGIYSTSARVIAVMLPPMAIFFPLFTLLEDMGYLPRVAFLLDRGMCKCGGCGKQALTLCMGLGCNAVGVMGCRIISSPRERLIATITNAMVPCNGRFPTLIVLGSLFFPRAGAALIVAVCVAMGVAGAMGTSLLLSRTCLRSKPSIFCMEIPPFRRPRLGQILVRSLLDRTLFVAGRALLVAAPAGVILWCMNRWGIMGSVIEILDPIGRILGMNGVILLSFILALPANELVIPVMLMGFSGVADLQQTAGMGTEVLLAAGLTWQMAVCTMVFTLYHWPCGTTLLTIYKETKSIKKTAAAAALPTAVGCLLCFILHWIL